MCNVDLTVLVCSNVDVCSSCLLPPDTSLTPYTLLHTVSTVRTFWEIGGLLYWLDVPYSVWNEIRANPSYSSEDEKRMAVLHYSLQTLPGMSWGKIAGVLWCLEEHTALESVRQYLPHKPGDYIHVTCIYSLVLVVCIDVHVLVVAWARVPHRICWHSYNVQPERLHHNCANISYATTNLLPFIRKALKRESVEQPLTYEPALHLHIVRRQP